MVAPEPLSFFGSNCTVTVVDSSGAKAESVPPPVSIVNAAAPGPLGFSTVGIRVVAPFPVFVIVKLLTSE